MTIPILFYTKVYILYDFFKGMLFKKKSTYIIDKFSEQFLN